MSQTRIIEKFCYFLRVRYYECDAQKVVFNGRYSDYADVAAGEFMKTIWGDYKETLANDIDYQVVSYSINWQASAYFDNIITITVEPIKIGKTSFTLQVNFYNYDTNSLIASAEIVYVMVSATELKKMLIPEHMREQLEKGALGIKIDHAGVNQIT